MMETLHGVMRTLNPERKSETRTADHLRVFREFMSHLDRISRQAPKPPRAKSLRVVKRASKR